MVNIQLEKLLGEEKALEAIKFTAELLKINEDVAEGYLVGLANGHGSLRNELSVKYPELVEANLEGKVENPEEVAETVVESAEAAIRVGEELKEKKEPEDLDAEASE